MDKSNVAMMVALLTSLIADKMLEASSLAKAAEACAREGNTAGAVQIALEVDQPLYEVQTLLNAAILIHRLPHES